MKMYKQNEVNKVIQISYTSSRDDNKMILKKRVVEFVHKNQK